MAGTTYDCWGMWPMIITKTTTMTSIAIVVLSALSGLAYGQTLTLDYTVPLDNTLADPNSNFSPQGLGYDTSSGELLYMQQSSNTIFRTDLNGVITGSRVIGFNHTTSVAGDGVYYYFSDYTANNSGLDLFRIDVSPPNSATSISAEVAAYGGYPIDVRQGNVYRTENTVSYDWSSLSQIRISSLGSVDTFTTLNLATTNGIGDIAVDVACNVVWVIDYSATASLRQFDLVTGSELANFPLGLDGLTAGLTFANNKLYYYDWNNGSGSTLSAYSISGSICGGMSATPVPTISAYGLALIALGLLLVASRRLRKPVSQI